VPITHRVALQHGRDRPRQRVSQDGQGVPLAVLFLYAGEPLLAGRMVPQEQHGGVGEGPREVGVPDLRAGGPLALTGRCLDTRDEAARRNAVLHPGKTADIMACIEPHQGHDLPHARDGAPPVEGLGRMLCGALPDRQGQAAESLVVVGDPCSVDCEALLHSWVGPPLGHAKAVGLVGDVLAARGQVILAVGLLDRRQELSPWPHQMDAAPPQVAGGPHLSRIDIGLGAHATAEPDGNCVRSDLLVCGVAAVHGFHGEGLPQGKGNTFLRPEVSQPIPGQQTLAGHDEPLAVRGDGLEKGFRSGFQVAVPQDGSRLMHDADVQAPSV
jgi:hypothetical protein